MSRWRLALACGALTAGCGGNWSQEDVTFASALPWQEDLRLSLPVASGASPSATSARRAADDVNSVLERLLVFADQVRRSPPAERTARTRRWGPFAATDAPGVSLAVRVEEQDAGVFTWALEVEGRGERRPLVEGVTAAGQSLRDGSGSLHAPLAQVRPLLSLPAPLGALDEVRAAWAHGAAATLTFTAAPTAGASWATPTLTSSRSAEHRALRLVRDAGVGALDFTATLAATGAGRAEGALLDGPYAGSTFSECWDDRSQTTWLAERWPDGGALGDEAACVAVE